jgi:hypothetical protein
MVKLEAKQFLQILFNRDEEICISPNKYGYHSVPLESVLTDGAVELLSPKGDIEYVSPERIQLVALNPIKGQRRDENATAFRTFLVEMDGMEISEQATYVRDMKMPYSACVFSGSKSLHFAIVLEEDLPSIDIYRFYAEWILGAMAKADQATKNPSRSIRFPGYIRDGREQKLLALKERVSLSSLIEWLKDHQDKKPQTYERRKPLEVPDAETIPRWIWKRLNDGLDPGKGRNNQWFVIAKEFGKAGYDEDTTIITLDQFFSEEYDFGKREWESAVRSGVRSARR